MGVPPALPGRQQKFDISGGRPPGSIDETLNREPPSTRKGVPSMDEFESLSHTKWEECNSPGSRIRRKEAELRRPAFLGEGILRIHSGAGHRSDTGLHQEAGRGGQAP